MTDPTETTRQLLRRAESYLSALHGSVARHDNLAANLGCAGCELRDQISAALPTLAAVPSSAPADRPIPDFTSPIAGRIEVREPCPWCPDRPMVPRSEMDEHVARLHPDVQTVEASSAGLVAVPPTTADRDRIELAIHSELTEYRLGRDTGMIVQRLTDAVVAVLAPPADRAALERVRAVLETEAVVGRTALEFRGLITAALMADDASATPVLPAGSEDTTTTQAAVALRDAADFYDQLLTDMGTDVSCDPRYWTAVRDIVRGLRCRAAETQPDTEAPHSCGNCEGEDPDTCWTNPNRPPEPCPAAEFGDYGQQCGKPVGHELHTFEEQQAAAVQTDEEA